MKKRSIICVFAVLALLAAGCSNDVVKEAGAEMEETQETSVVDGSASENQTEEETVFEDATEQVIVEGDNGVIRIGTTGTPYTELLTQAKLQLAKKGWDLQVEIYSDHETINQDVLEGNLDAHLFTHQTYIDSYNDVNGTELTAAAKVCFEKYGTYSVLNKDLTNVKSGVSVGIPEDETRKAKALLFLQDAGYITLKENVGLTAIMDDIVENPKDIQFVTYTVETAEDVLSTVDYCVMGADQAILAGFEPDKDVLKEETASYKSAEAMAALLVTTMENGNAEKLRLVENALKSDETKKYVEDTYKGALGLFP